MTRFVPAAAVPSGGLWSAAWPGLVAMALVGSSVTVVAVTQHLPVLAIQAARYAIAGGVLLILARAFRTTLVVPRGRDIVWVVLGSAVGFVGFTLAMILGTRHAEPGLLGSAVACIPIVLALSERISPLSQPLGSLLVPCQV